MPGVSSALPNSLAVKLSQNGAGAFANTGYWGIKVDSDWTYKASFFAKRAGPPSASKLTVTVSLSSETTETDFASHKFDGLTTEWKEFKTTLKPLQSAEGTGNLFVVRVEGGEANEEVLFGMFSLFPPTYKDRENGMRLDLAETFAACKPTVFRFPGGDDLEWVPRYSTSRISARLTDHWRARSPGARRSTLAGSGGRPSVRSPLVQVGTADGATGTRTASV